MLDSIGTLVAKDIWSRLSECYTTDMQQFRVLYQISYRTVKSDIEL